MLTYFPPTHKLSYSYAGHEPAWMQDGKTRDWSRLSAAPRRGMSDLPLAVLHETSFTHSQVKVKARDRLLLVTDGIFEAPNENDEQFGRQRLEDVLASSADADSQTLAERILDAVYAHAGTRSPRHDDLTFIILEFVDENDGPALWTAVKNRVLRPKGNSATFAGSEAVNGHHTVGHD